MDFGGRPIADGIRTRKQAAHIAGDRRMSKWALKRQAGWHRRKFILSQQDHFWDGIFVFRPQNERRHHNV